MDKQVTDFEPHIALFVPSEDPLLFYRSIAEFAQNKLRPGGSIFVEVHEDTGNEVAALFDAFGFSATVCKKDMQGKGRMIKACRQA